MSNLKVAIVHDWFAGYAGSERCVESFINIWPNADVFTLFNFLNEEEQKIILKGKQPKTSFVQNLPFAKSNHRRYLPFFPYAIEQFDLSGYDLIVSSSHAVAKGILTNTSQLHICYCHTPIRYAWDLTHQYLRESNLTKGLKGFIAKSILHYIRIWDASSSHRVDQFIANSNYIARRIKKVYQRDSAVIYPPVDVQKFELKIEKSDYFLTASRLVPYKRIDLIAEAFSQMPDKKLIIIGEGPDEEKIKAKAKRNVEFIGYQPYDKLKEYMQNAKAFVFAAEEDFGIMVVEALSCGTPVIALNRGGTAETVMNNESGVLYEEQSVEGIIEAVERFERQKHKFDAAAISNYAKKYSRDNFESKITNFVTEMSKEFFSHKIIDKV